MHFHYQNPQVLFRGKRVSLMTVEVEHPTGGYVTKELVAHPGAVVVLPFLDQERIVMIRNDRPIVQKTLWELPAGTLEKDEQPILCASRELIEETGYAAAQITPLLEFFSTPGFCNERLFVYLAKDLTFQGQNLDDTEKIEVEAITFTKALDMIKEGTIEDAKTICALLYFATYGR